MKLFIFISAFVIFSEFCYAAKLPDYITVCKRTDPDVSKCLRNALEKMRPHLTKEIPKIHIPKLEPMSIPKLEIDRKLENVAVKATFTDIVANGASKFVIDDLNVDPKKLEGELKVTLPKIDVTCKYDVEGQFLGIDANGKGKMSGEFNDIKVDILLSLKEIEKKGDKYLEIIKVNSKIRIGDGKMNLVDDNKNNQGSAETVMTFFNKNTRQALDIVKPIVDDTAAEVVSSVLGQMFEVVPSSEIFPSS